eukprot:g29550.t1
MREANPAACFSDKPAAVHFTDALADLLDWLPRLLGVSMDEMRTEDILFVSPRDFEVQSLLPRRCSLNGAVDYGLQDFFFRRWCCLKDYFSVLGHMDHNWPRVFPGCFPRTFCIAE